MNEENDDTIAKLVRAAGRRPRVDDDRTNRVRDAVHAEWQHRVQRRTRKRWALIAAAGVAVAATLAVILFLVPVERRPLQPSNMTLVSRVITTPGTHRWNGATLRVGPETRVIVADDVATLEEGTIYYSSGPGTRRVTIRTPFGDVRDIGTRFEVQVADDGVRVRVDEGLVELRGTTIGAGMQLFADHARIDQQLILEGQTLERVLEAIARAKGLRVRWETSSRNVTLHGTVPLSLDEALDAATAAAGVTYRIDGDELVVSP